MAYSALYRQYRPQTFSQVVGQEHIITTLRHQVQENRVAHAYLFCGTRGTGKTSVAKILARAMNCKNPQNGDPCLVCDACKHTSQECPDIVEIDAASNNGVNEMRDLRDKVRFAPLECRFKVYILDEAHMITHEAFNALLKTLEEPPVHAVFILATTEPHRLPATILSRCQRFEFHRFSISEISQHLEKLLADLDVKAEAQALETIARAAQGAMRDALSITDQCIGFCQGEIRNQDVLNVLGSMDDSFLFDIAQYIIDGDSSKVLHAFDDILMQGRDLGVFCNDLLQHFRALMLVQTSGASAKILLSCTDDQLSHYQAQVLQCSLEKILRAISILSEAESTMKWMSTPRVLLECKLLQLCYPDQTISLDALSERVAHLEKGTPSRPVIASSPSSPNAPMMPESSQIDKNIPDTHFSINEKHQPNSITKPAPAQNETKQPSNDSSAQTQKDAAHLFSLIVSRQSTALAQMFALYQWHPHFESTNTLCVEAPANCLPTLVQTLSEKADELAQSVHDQHPGLRLRIVTSGSARQPSHPTSSQDSPPATPVNEDLFSQASDFFGADFVKKID